MRIVYLLAVLVTAAVLSSPQRTASWIAAVVLVMAGVSVIFGRLEPVARLWLGCVLWISFGFGSDRLPLSALVTVGVGAVLVLSFAVPTWLSPVMTTGLFLGLVARTPDTWSTKAVVMAGMALAGMAFGMLAHQQKRLERERKSFYTTSGELTQSLRQVEYLAFHDVLTGLPNRRLTTARLEQALAQAGNAGRSAAVAFIDVDRFKSVNDSAGHSFGDRLLKAVATSIGRSLLPGDVLGRQGGDEFILLMSSVVDTQAAWDRLEVVRRQLQDGLELDGQKIFATASFGVAMFPHDGRTTDELLRHADAALYRAKEEGRNRIAFYSPELEQAASKAVYLDTAIRQALARSEFRLEYQPQVDILTGRLVGVEALIRWDGAAGQVLMPDAFLPDAQKLGLMDAIDDWVMERALSEVSQLPWWRHEPVTLALNVSATRLDSPDFVPHLLDLLKRFPMSPDRLEIEITESVMSRHAELVIAHLRELRRCGIGVALDDFGVGYSSLSYLKHLPVTRLKIDRSFVADVDHNSSIARAIVAIAKSLRLELVAEGVETLEQADGLVHMGCDVAQGFYYAASVPASALQLKYRPDQSEHPA